MHNKAEGQRIAYARVSKCNLFLPSLLLLLVLSLYNSIFIIAAVVFVVVVVLVVVVADWLKATQNCIKLNKDPY